MAKQRASRKRVAEGTTKAPTAAGPWVWPAETNAVLQQWFTSRYGQPNSLQQRAWPHTFAGENTLLLSPTGSGKTLAAFFAVLSQLGQHAHREELPNATLAIYLSPLRALGRDIHRNLLEPLEHLNAQLPPRRRIRMEVRTGDTSATARSRMQRKHPHLLLTTPESLSSLLSQQSWREGFEVQQVIVDEIHAFAENKRGSLMALCLERLEARLTLGPKMQRIGLSATASPIAAVQRLLCGQRPCQVVEAGEKRPYVLEIATPDRLPAAGFDPGRISTAVAEAVEKGNSSIAFCSTRSGAERLGVALTFHLPEEEERIAVHHGSIERKRREEIEEALANGRMKCVVCSTSLELGVDYAGVDQVLLVGTPRGVSRAVQRLGRSGHRSLQPAYGKLIPLSLPDLLEAAAMRRAVAESLLDDLRVPEAPLDVLAQVLLGLAVERRWSISDAWQLVKRAGPYLELPQGEFRAVLAYLAGGGKVLARYGKIVVEDGHFQVATKRIAREYFQAIGCISEDFKVRVMLKNNRRLGEVEEGFLSALRPGEAFLMGGKVVEVVRVEGAIAIVKPSTSERVQTPRWMGGKMPLSARMAEEELALRRAVRAAWQSGGAQAVQTLLQQEYQLEPPHAKMATAFIARQCQAAPVPVDNPFQLERVVRGPKQLLQVHCVAGRAVNQSLAWVVAWRLAGGHSVVSNANDHGFLLAMDARVALEEARLREAFSPVNFSNDLETVLRGTETLGRKFRQIAETGQLIPRRTYSGVYNKKFSAWNGSLLYQTLLQYEPDHILVRETVREVLEDTLDAHHALQQAERIYESAWEWFDHPRPSPFALPLYAAFNRDVLLAADSHRAFDELATAFYEEWAEEELGE